MLTLFVSLFAWHGFWWVSVILGSIVFFSFFYHLVLETMGGFGDHYHLWYPDDARKYYNGDSPTYEQIITRPKELKRFLEHYYKNVLTQLLLSFAFSLVGFFWPVTLVVLLLALFAFILYVVLYVILFLGSVWIYYKATGKERPSWSKFPWETIKQQ